MSALMLLVGACAVVALCAAKEYQTIQSQQNISLTAGSRSDTSGKSADSKQNAPTINTEPSEVSENQAAPDPKALSSTSALTTQSGNTAAPSCSLDVASLTRNYQTKLQKAKSLLDSQVSFPAGVNITSQYVQSYNGQAAKTYDWYTKEMTDANCAISEQRPAPLPDTYPS